VVLASLLPVDAARSDVSFDAEQGYWGDAATVESNRDRDNLGEGDFHERDTYTHVQRARVAPGAVVILQREAEAPPASGHCYGPYPMFLSSFQDFKRRLLPSGGDPGGSRFWVVLRHRQVVALVELADP